MLRRKKTFFLSVHSIEAQNNHVKELGQHNHSFKCNLQLKKYREYLHIWNARYSHLTYIKNKDNYILAEFFELKVPSNHLVVPAIYLKQ